MLLAELGYKGASRPHVARRDADIESIEEAAERLLTMSAKERTFAELAAVSTLRRVVQLAAPPLKASLAAQRLDALLAEALRRATPLNGHERVEVIRSLMDIRRGARGDSGWGRHTP